MLGLPRKQPGMGPQRMKQNSEETIRMKKNNTKSHNTEPNTQNKMAVNQMEPSSHEKETSNKKDTGKMTPRRIAALLGVILLASLYLITLIVAIVDKSSSGTWFMLCMIGTVTIPLLIWIYTWMYGVLTNRRTIATIEPEHRDGAKTTDPNTQEMQSKESNNSAASDK